MSDIAITDTVMTGTATTGAAIPGALPGTGRVVLAQLRYQVTLITRTPAAFVFGMALPAVLLILQIGRHHVATATLTTTIGGLVVFGMLAIAYLTYASGLIAARESGVLRRWHAAPVPTWGYFAGRIVASVAMADVAALLLLVVGATMCGLHLTLMAAVSMVIAVTAGAIALASAGTAITPLLPSVQGANGMLAISYLPLLFLAGGFGSVSSLPHWLTRAMTYLPVQPAIDAASRALADPGSFSGRDLLVLGCWTVACLALSARYFRWDPTRPKHAARVPAHAAGVPAAGPQAR
jgi:ABC-2 type transport system permease protein